MSLNTENFLNNIYDKVTSLFGSREEGVKTKSKQLTEYMVENISDNIMPVIMQCEDKIDILKANESGKEFSLVKSALKVSSIKDFLDKYKKYASEVNNNVRLLQDSINGIMSDSVNDKSMNYAQYSLFTLLENTASNLETGLRVINHIMINNKGTLTSTKEISNVLNALPMFKVDVIDNKENIKQKLDNIKKLPKTNIYDAIQNDIPESVLKNTLPNISRFNGNPIYTFRKWLVRRDAEKLNKLEVLKSEISNRILELEEERAGASSENLATIRNQIEWYEEKLNKIDAEIYDIENR